MFTDIKRKMVKEERNERQHGKPLMMWLNRDEVLETIKNRRPEVMRIPNFLHFSNQSLYHFLSYYSDSVDHSATSIKVKNVIV